MALPLESREWTALSGSALGSLVGGLLASPLGPWAAIGGATVGTTLGGYLAQQFWQQYYLDLGRNLGEVRRLLELEDPDQAAALLMELRAHPRFGDQEANLRAELEHTAGRVLSALAERAERAGQPAGALTFVRRARLFAPREASLLWDEVRLATAAGEPGYVDSARLQEDLELLLRLEPAHAGALRALAEFHERQGRVGHAARVLAQGATAATERPALREELLRGALKLVPEDLEAVRELAGLLLDAARFEAALEVLERHAPCGPCSPELALARARALHGCGRFHEALGLLEPLVETDPAAALLAGTAAAHAGETARAVAILSALASEPAHGAQAALALVPLLLAAGELDLAFNHLQRDGLDRLPGYEELLRRMATAFEARGLEEKASQVYDRMRVLGDSTSFWARFALQLRDGRPICLGHGALGRVLLGRRRSDSQPVAIREAPAPFSLGGKAALRFCREVEMLGHLRHPHLVELLGHALPEGKYLLAMEYCSGGTLADRLSRPLLWPESKAIVSALLEALGFLHRQDPPVVHRDVKPASVLFASDGTVKLGDFSRARVAAGAGTSVVTSVGERTQAFVYSSPEVILGQTELGPAADVYSLGCVLYQMLTGRPPFEHADVNRLIAAHLQERPEPPSRLAAWVPAALDRAALVCLEKDPAKRYSDVERLWSDLEHI